MPNLSGVNNYAARAVQDPRYPKTLTLVESGARVVQFATLFFDGGSLVSSWACTLRAATSGARLPRDVYKVHDGSFAAQRLPFHCRDVGLIIVHIAGLVTILRKTNLIKSSVFTTFTCTAGKYCWVTAMGFNLIGKATAEDPQARQIGVAISEFLFPLVEVFLAAKVPTFVRVVTGVTSGAILFLHNALPDPLH